MGSRQLRLLLFVSGANRYGASLSIRNLAKALADKGHEVTFLTFRSGFSKEDLAGIPCMEIQPFNKFSLLGMLRLRKRFRQFNPDLVHTHLSVATLSGSFAARLAKIPVISTVHGMNKRWTYSFADRLITVSEAAKQYLVDQGIPASRISVAYNGIEIPPVGTPAKRSQVRASLGVGEDTPVLASVSRADYAKGIQDAIFAIAFLRRQFPQIRYFFAGEGEYLDSLKAHAKALGVEENVMFLGFREDVQELLAAADLFIFPSHKEAMGIAAVEAMAQGIAIIGTNTGGIPEVIDPSSGLLVPPNNPQALAKACRHLLAEPALRKDMGTRARAIAIERFSLSASAEAVERAYAELLEGCAQRLSQLPTPNS